VHRARHARQILSGAELEPPTRLSSAWVSPSAGLTESQRTYLIALGVLLLVGLVLLATVGLDVASIVFFILALGLIGGWLAF
jgi:Flp pilus assembly protein TadB